MPPKQKITKEMILDAAYEITRDKGIGEVNSRVIAKKLQCSTQPIFSQFSTIEELKAGVFDLACQKGMEEIMKFKDEPDFMPRTSMWVIHLARNKPNIYHLLYLSNSFQSKNLIDVMLNYESNREILDKMQELYGLDEQICKDILLKGFLMLHGIATMIATNHMAFTDEDAARIMKQTVYGMVCSAKGIELQ